MANEIVAIILSGYLLAALEPSAARIADDAAVVDASVCPVTEARAAFTRNDSLGVVLWSDSKFVFKPGGPGLIDRDGALGMKVGWELRKRGTLIVTGRRLDGVAPPARAYIGRNYDNYVGGMSLYLLFPTPGCWEITGSIAGGSLTFVTLVEKIGDGPGGRLDGPPPGRRVSQ